MNNQSAINLETDLGDNPFHAFGQWFTQAETTEKPFPNATILATCENAKPTARVVLLKSWDENGFVFFTNYTSHKARALETNPHASLLFYWNTWFRQLRIEGITEKIPRDQSKAYFASRPRASRIGAWASKQSQALDSRRTLDARIDHYEARFANTEPSLPDFWGGLILQPLRFEFWQGEDARLHQRREYTRVHTDAPWVSQLLYP